MTSSPLSGRARLTAFIERWGLFIVAGALLATLWILIAVASSYQRERWIDSARRELSQLNGAIALHTDGMFRSVDTALRTMDQWLQANPHIDPRREARFIAMVDEFRKASDGLLDLRMLSSDGWLYLIPSAAGAAPSRVSDQPALKEHLDGNKAAGERKPFIGDPIFSPVTRNWTLPISWRLESPVSDIRVVFAVIELDRLFALHETLRLKPSGSIVLLRADGVVLSHTPYLQSLIGNNLSDSASFKNEFGVKNRGTFLADAALSDPVPHLTSYERLSRYPVSVLVTQGLEDTLAPFYQRRNDVLAGIAFLSLVVIAFTFLLNRALSARHSAEREMRLLAMTDSLTGAMSRRAFMDALERELRRARRYGRPLAMITLDIDHFKEVNDIYGHAAGDAVLRECAVAARRALRTEDHFGRTGGEEFCAILPEVSLESAKIVANRLRRAVAEHRVATEGREIAVTVSVGLTAMLADEEQLAPILQRADRALYLAKSRGRNRVEVLE